MHHLLIVVSDLAAISEPLQALVTAGASVIEIPKIAAVEDIQAAAVRQLRPQESSPAATFRRLGDRPSAAPRPMTPPPRKPISGTMPSVDVRHRWIPTDEPHIDRCGRCAMQRETLAGGAFRFISRTGDSYERPPFRGVTPSCDAFLEHTQRAV